MKALTTAKTSIAAPSVQLRLIGDAALRGGDGASRHLNRKDAAMLAVLALDGPCPRERMLGLLWPDKRRERALTNLRQRALRLRRLLGCEVMQVGDTIRLAAFVAADTNVLRAQGLPADEPPPGELLGNFEYGDGESLNEWVNRARERWHAWCVEALDSCAARHEQLGDLALALMITERLVAHAPAVEHGWRRLIRLNWLRGDRSAAIAAFERCERALKDETGLRPSEQTLHLLDQVEQGSAPVLRRLSLPATLLQPPQLIGRDAELTAMRHAWDGGRSFLLVAEAGMGKSRLLEAFGAGQIGVIAEQARAGDENVPNALLVRVLAPALVEIAEAIDEEARSELARLLPGFGVPPVTLAHPVLMRRAIEQGLEAAAATTGLRAVLLDDLQAADEASIDTLLSLIASPKLGALRFGLAMRQPPQGSAAERLLKTVGESGGPDLLRLRALGEAQIHELIGSLALHPDLAAPQAKALVEHTGGNPLFVLETLRDVVLQGPQREIGLPRPASVLALIRHRLSRLPADALALARLAAVADADFTVELAVALTGEPVLSLTDRWATLESAQVLLGDRFAHDLVAQVLLEDLPAVVCDHLHAQIALWLEGRQAPAGRIASHWADAQRWSEAGLAWERAAAEGARVGRIGQQCRALRSAAAAWRRAGEPSQEFDALALLHEPLWATQGLDAARQVTDTLLTLAPDPLRKVQADIWVLRDKGMSMTHLDEVVCEATRIIAHLKQFDAPLVLCDALYLRGQALGVLMQPERAIADLQKARDLAQSHGSSSQLLACVSALSHALMWNESVGECLPVLLETVNLAERLADPVELSVLTGNLAVVRAAMGDYDEALHLALRAQASHHRLESGDGPNSLANVVTIASCYTRAGHYGDAIDVLGPFLSDKGQYQPSWLKLKAKIALAHVWHQLGQHARAVATLASDESDIPRILKVNQQCLLAMVARDARETQAYEQALTSLSTMDRGSETQVVARLQMTSFLAPERALEELRTILRDAKATGQLALHLAASMRRLECLAESGAEQMDGIAAEVLSLLRQLPGKLYHDMPLTRAWLACARLLTLIDRPQGANRAIWRARRWLTEAREHVPEEFIYGFERVNPVHRAILAWPESDSGRPVTHR